MLEAASAIFVSQSFWRLAIDPTLVLLVDVNATRTARGSRRFNMFWDKLEEINNDPSSCFPSFSDPVLLLLPPFASAKIFAS